MVDINTFTWDNLPSDGGAYSHVKSVQLFLNSIVMPSIRVLDQKIDELLKSEDAVAAFELSDYKPLREATLQGYALIIHSMWERQLQGCLRVWARDLAAEGQALKPNGDERWPGLQQRFLELRGIGLVDFQSFPDLDLLQLIANACRHGDGRSATELYQRCPSLWPHAEPPDRLNAACPSFSQATFSTGLLAQMARAVVWFWEDYEYIYNNSIKRKHPSTVRSLENQRKARSQRVRAWPTEGATAAS